jgi:hypothetical protein
MPRREHSKWTHIYFGADVEKGKPWYIRFVPDFMDLEKTGLPHGLSISGNYFATEEEAAKAADFYDKFFDKMAEEIVAESKEIRVEEGTVMAPIADVFVAPVGRRWVWLHDR